MLTKYYVQTPKLNFMRKFLLLTIILLPLNLTGAIRIQISPYPLDDNRYIKKNSLLADANLLENYENETILTDRQKKLIYPITINPQEYQLFNFAELGFGSEERLIKLNIKILENFLTDDLQNWGEKNDNLVEIEETFLEPKPDTSIHFNATKNILQRNNKEPQKKFTIAPHNDVMISVNQKRVQSFINFYTNKKRKIFSTGLHRAPQYYKMVKRIFTEHGLPHDLFYLAMVESNFNYKAISKARAVGLWQFIASTGKNYGMTYSWWHDDRLDAEKLTYAAAQFLTDLYKKYGDWALVLAAYNSGARTVNRAIAKNKKLGKPTNYWSLKLPKETRGYVPAFLAVVHIFNNLERYNFPIPKDPEDWLEYKTVNVKPSISFSQISKKTSLSITDLKKFNPALKYSMTPFRESPYSLKIPIDSNISQKQLASLKPDFSQDFITYKIKNGDNLWTISRKYQTSLKALYLSNPNLTATRYLKPNQKIIIPINSRILVTSKSKTDSSSHSLKKIHIVRKGDSLWSIAKKYKTNIKTLINKNYHINSSKDIIIIGSKINL